MLFSIMPECSEDCKNPDTGLTSFCEVKTEGTLSNLDFHNPPDNRTRPRFPISPTSHFQGSAWISQFQILARSTTNGERTHP
jgi:hypothetical protein